jgi:ribose transport system substrate-binding protein
MARGVKLAVAVLALIATACSGGSSPAVSQSAAAASASAATASASAATASASAATPSASEVAALPCSGTGVQYVGAGPLVHPYVQQAQTGFETEAKAHNRTYQWVQPTEFDMAKEIQLVETALGYTCLKGIGFWTNEHALFKGVVSQAAAKNIPVATIGCQPMPFESPVCMEIDNTKAFQEVGKQFADRLGGKGNLVVSTGVEPSQDFKYNVLKDYLAKNYPDIKILGTVADCDDPLKTVACAENALAKYPTMNAYASTGFNNAIGAAKVFPQAGRKDIVVQGVDNDPVVIQGIKDGTVAFTLQQSPVLQGRLFFLIPFWGAEEGLKPITDHQYIDTPGFIVDKTNVDNYVQAQSDAADGYIATVKGQFFK